MTSPLSFPRAEPNYRQRSLHCPRLWELIVAKETQHSSSQMRRTASRCIQTHPKCQGATHFFCCESLQWRRVWIQTGYLTVPISRDRRAEVRSCLASCCFHVSWHHKAFGQWKGGKFMIAACFSAGTDCSDLSLLI